jgi:hypothetical protein
MTAFFLDMTVSLWVIESRRFEVTYSYYESIFTCERNNPQIRSTEAGKPFTINL